eukprot:gnl/TRDRNA2_/TRDRNA2_47940_c0_seq1.p1 gnl/TRDRNA2_/TRDRNA2_47940_c0~~gnl/TRDRNA2_/TRDRNA2_47940_c0_seq1.p1  ORF type:complete len:150 (-),score=13.78 gnl/TRDRNA2_/TRDRNA2_47940_c0_seq1:121-537(-)
MAAASSSSSVPFGMADQCGSASGEPLLEGASHPAKSDWLRRAASTVQSLWPPPHTVLLVCVLVWVSAHFAEKGIARRRKAAGEEAAALSEYENSLWLDCFMASALIVAASALLNQLCSWLVRKRAMQVESSTTKPLLE